MSPDYGLSIAEAFQKYLKTGEERYILPYSIKELKGAISRLSPYYNNNRLWFRQIERRIEELSNNSDKQGSFVTQLAGNKWFDKIIAFGAGILFGLLF